MEVKEKNVFEFTKDDIEQNKVMGVLAYIFFLIPLLAAKESPFAKFHTNQGLLVFLAAAAVNIVGGIIPFIGWILIIPLGNLAILVLGIMGIINAANGKAKKLPVIGNIEILK